MVYTKNTWVDDDPTKPLSAGRLNHLETQYDEAVSVALTASNLRGFSVANYGAVGDGITDDAAAIQAAYTACATVGGGTVVFSPSLTYLIGSSIIVSSNTFTEGNGAAVRSLQGSSKTTFVNQSIAGAVGYGAGGRNIHFRNLTIKGDYVNGAGDVTTGWNHVENLSFTNCKFEQGMVNGHYIDLGGCKNVRVINCTFLGMNPVSGREYIEAIQVDVNTLQASSWKSEPATAFDGLPTRGVLIEGCYFTTITVGGSTYGVPNPAGSHSAALGTEAGIYQSVSFVNNIVEGYNTPATNDTFGWLHFRGIRGLEVSHNTFIYTGVSGVTGNPCVLSVIPITNYMPLSDVGSATPTTSTLGTPQQSEEITIIGNRFIGFANAPQTADSGLINLDTAVRAIVSNNTCNGSSSSLVRAVSARCRVSQNDFVLNSTEPGIKIVGNTSTDVADNTLIGFAGGVGIQTSGGGNIRVSRNTILGGAVGIRITGADGSLIQENFVRDFTTTGLSIGDTGASGTCFDPVISGNRVRTTTSGATNLLIGATTTRARRYGNVFRDPGTVTDNGTGTTTVATDQTS